MSGPDCYKMDFQLPPEVGQPPHIREIYGPAIPSYAFLMDLMSKWDALLVNAILVPQQLCHTRGTTPKDHPSKTDLFPFYELEGYLQNNLRGNEMCTTSTTFARIDQRKWARAGYPEIPSFDEASRWTRSWAIPSMDIDFRTPTSNAIMQSTIKRLCNRFKISIGCVETQNGYHILCTDLLVGDDVTLWQVYANLLRGFCENPAFPEKGRAFGKHWAERIMKVQSFEDIQNLASSILVEVKSTNPEFDNCTFVDLRHLAHGALSNDRRRGEPPDAAPNGVRTQLFVRVGKKHAEAMPYVNFGYNQPDVSESARYVDFNNPQPRAQIPSGMPVTSRYLLRGEAVHRPFGIITL